MIDAELHGDDHGRTRGREADDARRGAANNASSDRERDGGDLHDAAADRRSPYSPHTENGEPRSDW